MHYELITDFARTKAQAFKRKRENNWSFSRPCGAQNLMTQWEMIERPFRKIIVKLGLRLFSSRLNKLFLPFAEKRENFWLVMCMKVGEVSQTIIGFCEFLKLHLAKLFTKIKRLKFDSHKATPKIPGGMLIDSFFHDFVSPSSIPCFINSAETSHCASIDCSRCH